MSLPVLEEKEELTQFIEKTIETKIRELLTESRLSAKEASSWNERFLVLETELKHQREVLVNFQVQVDKRFEQVDKRFEQVNKRFEEMLHNIDKRFEQVDKRFEEILHNVDKRFEQVDKRFVSIQWMMSLGFIVLGLLVSIFGLLK